MAKEGYTNVVRGSTKEVEARKQLSNFSRSLPFRMTRCWLTWVFIFAAPN